MLLALPATGNDANALTSLEKWLRREPELRGIPIIAVPRLPAEGEMGAVGEILEVATQNKEIITALVATIGIWLENRRSATTIFFRNGDREVEISTDRPLELDEFSKRVLKELFPDGETNQ
ncbi:hypothetical protein OHS32_26000 [Micromonospora chokoriensis]